MAACTSGSVLRSHDPRRWCAGDGGSGRCMPRHAGDDPTHARTHARPRPLAQQAHLMRSSMSRRRCCEACACAVRPLVDAVAEAAAPAPAGAWVPATGRSAAAVDLALSANSMPVGRHERWSDLRESRGAAVEVTGGPGGWAAWAAPARAPAAAASRPIAPSSLAPPAAKPNRRSQGSLVGLSGTELPSGRSSQRVRQRVLNCRLPGCCVRPRTLLMRRHGMFTSLFCGFIAQGCREPTYSLPATSIICRFR